MISKKKLMMKMFQVAPKKESWVTSGQA